MSVAVSSIVLLYATIQEARQKQIAEMQEKRAQEDHEHVTEMHRLVLETLAYQQQELESLKELFAGLRGQTYTRKEIAPAPDLYTLHPRGDERFSDEDLAKRWQQGLYHNELVTKLREYLTPDD